MYSRVKGMAKKCKLLTIFTKTIMHLVPSPPPPKEIFFLGGGGWESKQDALCIMVLVKNGE